MNNEYVFNSNFISGIHIDEYYGIYEISCKSGNLCYFDLNQVSNQPHLHNCFELCLVTSGEGFFVYKNNIFNISVGDIFIADPGEIHEVQVSKHKDLQLIFFFIDIMKINNSEPKKSEDKMLHAFIGKHKVISNNQKHLLAYLSFIENYYTQLKTKGYGIYQAIKNLILESLNLLAFETNQLTETKVILQSTLELALDYIDRHLNEKIRINDIALHCCTSERNLQLLFKRHLNKTIIDYINEKKINLASHYLIRQYSVNDTSAQIGINDTSQFTRLFKKFRSVTPKKYQKANLIEANKFGRREQIRPNE